MHQNCLDVQMINHKTLGLVQLTIVGLQPTFRRYYSAFLKHVGRNRHNMTRCAVTPKGAEGLIWHCRYSSPVTFSTYLGAVILRLFRLKF